MNLKQSLKMFESLLTDMAREMGANVDKNAFSLDEAMASDDFENKRRTTKTAQKKNSIKFPVLIQVPHSSRCSH